ncbi:MAG: trypsin-like peptidase domain-containing protein [Anaerolineae bacterium]|nr:trypsin-like peptidase domain-containing protein [Anaerolineae bacterium]
MLRSRWLAVVRLLIVFFAGGLLGAAAIFAFVLLPVQMQVNGQTRLQPMQPTPTPLPDSVFSEVEAKDQVVINLYQRVSQSVVHITSRTQSIGFYGVVPSEGTGSGFIIDTQGHIVTNNHVVADADEVEVVLANSLSYTAKIVGADQYYDLAVLQIDAPAEQLIPLELGDSSILQIGQSVIAIGNPFGLDRTLTLGIVSALNRQVVQDSGSVIGQAIQTDAAINPGNSGGPLLNLRGQVIGVNASISTPSGGSVGIGFAVPVNVVKRVVPVLMSQGRYPHPSLNVQVAELGNEVRPPTNGPSRGLLIIQLQPGGAADRAGLKAAQVSTQRGRYVFSGGDIIVSVNEKPVSTRNDLLIALEENSRPGDTIKMSVVRDNQIIDVQVTLDEQ